MAVIPGTIGWDDVLPEIQSGTLTDEHRAALAVLARDQLIALADDLDARRRRTLLSLVAGYGSQITISVTGEVTYPGPIAAFLRSNTEGQRTSGVGTRVAATLHALVLGTGYRSAILHSAVVREDVQSSAALRCRVLNGPLVSVPAVALHCAVSLRGLPTAAMHCAVKRYGRTPQNTPTLQAAIAQRQLPWSFIRVWVTVRSLIDVALHCQVNAEYPPGESLLDESGANLQDESASTLQTG